MRISDWSSDVCSSDLRHRGEEPRRHRRAGLRQRDRGGGRHGASRLPGYRQARVGRGRLRQGRRGAEGGGYGMTRRTLLIGSGSYLPERILTNEELAARVDTSDEWILQRTGIGQRHIAADGELTSDLRSEEHTSELQSLMRISYAVFRLKKQKTTHTS